MLPRLVALATLIFLVVSSPAAAQDIPASGGEIRGHVINAATKAPITTAKVAAATVQTSTDTDGNFRLQGLQPGHYSVRILALGYAPREVAVEIGPASASVDVGTVTLTAAVVVLQPLQITGQKQDVELAPDRNIYVVRDMPTTRGGTALDVLRNVPAVDVDIDNIVSLRGNFLAQVPADMVDKVEVIPNPSARENPEGDAGIINIVLKQAPDEGRSGGLTVGGGTTGHVDVGGNRGYERGPLSLFGSYGFLRDNRPRRDTIFRENNYQSPLTYLEEAGLRTQIPLAHTLTGSAGYQ